MATNAAAQSPSEILNKRQLDALNRAMAAIDKAATECDIAESCFGACVEQRQRIQDAYEMVSSVKAAYFPGAK